MQAEAVVGGHYRLDAVAGAGGMGTVYLAHDLESGKRCAVKLVAADATPHALERFALEAAVLAKLAHPAVVRCLDHGESPPFLVMEWVEGECLADRLLRGGVAPEDALRLGEKLVLALAAVHAAGVVHRDLKPRNVMLPGGSFDAPVLVDFGVARSPDLRHTRSGARVGTPRYMAPEQIVSARRVDGRADVFSLGCVLFEMLTGRKTFRGRDEVAVLARMVIEDAPRVRSVRPDVPAEVDALVARLLVRDPKRRPHATEELARELGSLAERLRDLRAAERVEEHEPDSTRDGTPGELTVLVSAPSLAAPSEPPRPTVGREAEMERLARGLAPGAVVGLWGPVGVGKSHLGAAVARAASKARAAVVCDVRGARGDEIVRRLAAELELVRASPDDVCAAVAARGALVVLDECDGALAEIAAFGARLVREAPAASVLLVSRAQAPIATTFELAPLDAERSAELFVACSRGAATLPRDAQAVETITRALHGNPLAIGLAAVRASTLGLAAIATRASRPLELVGASFREALEDAWSSLPDVERRAATALAIFPGAVHPEHAVAVAAAIAGESAALDAVESLRNRSLLRAGPRGTLKMDPAMRELAREKLEAAGASFDAAKRAFVRVTLARAASLESLAGRVALEPDLVAAFDFAESLGDTDGALDVALAIEPALVSRGPLGRLASMLDRALALGGGSTHARARALASRGRTATLARDFDRAERCFTEAMQLAAGTPELEASTWLDRGVMQQIRGDLDSAERCYGAVLDVEDAGRASEARARGNLGALAHDRGDLDVAYTHYVRAIAVAEAIEEPRLFGVFLTNLAVLDRERGRPGVARQRFARALHALEDARDARLVGIALGNLGMLELVEDRVDAALAAFSRSAETLAAIGDAHSEALAQARLGAARAVSGHVAASEAALARAERLAGRDETTLAIVRFFRAFPEQARAKLGGEGTEAFAERVRARVAAAQPLASTNDDVRAALEVLQRLAQGVD